MSTEHISNYFSTGINDYLISGNLTNSFVIGEVGSLNDFFLIGTEPPEEAPYPMITANFLDSEGNILFRIVRNIFVVNPHNCSKFVANLSGYEIHDSAGKLILKVTTVFNDQKGFITNIQAQGYNKNRELVFDANESAMNISTKSVLGFDKHTGNFGITNGFQTDELEFIRTVFRTGAKIHQPLMGKVQNQEILLDGKAIINANLKECKLIIRDGNFIAIGPCTFDTCNFELKGNANNIYEFVKALEASNTKFINAPAPPIKPSKPPSEK